MTRWGTAKISAFCMLRAEGLLNIEIAELMGISKDSVRKMSERLHLEGRIKTEKTWSPWTEEQKTKLNELWELDLSCRQIGDILGVSRNSVIGRAHRAGLTSKKGRHHRRPLVAGEKPQKSAPVVSPPHKRVRIQKWTPHVSHLARVSWWQPHISPPITASDKACAVTLLDAKPWHCRYVVSKENERPYLFCGQPTTNGSWCSKHANVVFTPKTVNVNPRPFYRSMVSR